MSTHNISRRSVAKGVAWAAPAVAIAASAPSLSASPAPCTTESMAAIDKAFADALNIYRCNGAKPRLELNFYQSPEAVDGWGTTVWLNVKNLSSCSITFTPENPLRLAWQIRAEEDASGRRDVTMATSWGYADVTWAGGTGSKRVRGTDTIFDDLQAPDADADVTRDQVLYNSTGASRARCPARAAATTRPTSRCSTPAATAPGRPTGPSRLWPRPVLRRWSPSV